MKPRTIYSLLLVFLLGAACQKEPFWKKDKDPCTLDFSTGDCWPLTTIQQGPSYSRPCFNPNNGDEIVFLEGSSPDAGLVKYNIRTGAKTTILTGSGAASTPEWGRQGWITFHSSIHNVVKVRDDGSEMTTLNQWGAGLYPAFSEEGDRIVFARHMSYSSNDIKQDPSLREDYKIIIIDLDGSAVDSFCRSEFDDVCYPWQECAWSPNGNTFAAERGPDRQAENYGMAVYDTDGNTVQVLFSVNEISDIGEIIDIDWHPNGTDVYFVDFEGIKRVNTETLEVDLVRISCGNERYGPLAISPDGKFLVAERVMSIREACKVVYVHTLSLMTTDGLNEAALPLP